MSHPGNWCPTAAFYIRGSSSNGTSCRNPSEQNGTNVSESLSYQFHVGAMPGAEHPIRHNRRQQRFEGSQESNCYRWREHLLHQRQRHYGDVRKWQMIWYAAEPATNCRDRQIKELDYQRANKYRDQHSWH